MSLDLLLAVAIAVLVAGALYCFARARVFDMLLGLALLSHGVNLFLFAMGRPAVDRPPILRAGLPASLEYYVDPLPQALVLTAIVIGFAMTALVAALALLRVAPAEAGTAEPTESER